MSQRSYTSEHLHMKELSETFHDFEIADGRMLETNLNLERYMTIHQGTEKTQCKEKKHR